jgi:hypothetical protein
VRSYKLRRAYDLCSLMNNMLALIVLFVAENKYPKKKTSGRINDQRINVRARKSQGRIVIGVENN